MTGAAIASVGVSLWQGSKADDNADKAQAASDAAAARAAEYQDKAIATIEGNQFNVDALQGFLSEMSAQGVENAQGMLDRWEGAFGGVQDNMSEFFNNLDPAKFATQSKAAFSAELDKSMSQFNETMAASGLQSAGMKQQAAKEAAFQKAEGMSKIDIASEEYVADQKMGWLQFGESQRQEGDQAMVNAQNKEAILGQTGFQAQTNQTKDLAGAYLGGEGFESGQASAYGKSAAGYESAAGNYYGSAMSSGLKAWEGITGGSDPLAGTLDVSDMW